uniref:Uncharacterized protein n=1 Tax=Lepeophtheirus salmonis TaxID=72036 RepID=A0A0K2V714_LEPSM
MDIMKRDEARRLKSHNLVFAEGKHSINKSLIFG